MSLQTRHSATSPETTGTAAGTMDVVTEVQRKESLLKTGALQNAIFNSANFWLGVSLLPADA